MSNRAKIKISVLQIVFIAFLGITTLSLKASSAMLDSARWVSKIDSIKLAYQQIEYEGPYALSFYTALSAYPELNDVNIQFRQRNIKTTMQCRPKTFSVLRKPAKRKFVMVFNQNRGVPINELSFNARVGLFAHEIAHVLDYLQMTSGQTIGLGFRYISEKGQIALEHEIDRMVIWKGFGHQILQYAKEVLRNSSITDDYRQRRSHVYLKPSEIKQLISIVENNPSNVNR